MAVIWKYPLDLHSHPSITVIDDLTEPQVLCVAYDYDKEPCVWVAHHGDDDWALWGTKTESVTITGFWTGWSMKPEGNYLGSLQVNDLMWHFWATSQ